MMEGDSAADVCSSNVVKWQLAAAAPHNGGNNVTSTAISITSQSANHIS